MGSTAMAAPGNSAVYAPSTSTTLGTLETSVLSAQQVKAVDHIVTSMREKVGERNQQLKQTGTQTLDLERNEHFQTLQSVFCTVHFQFHETCLVYS